LTFKNLEATIVEFERIYFRFGLKVSCIAQVHFLSQIFGSLIDNLSSDNKQTPNRSNEKLQILVIQKFLEKFAYTYSFGTTICCSLRVAFSGRHGDQEFLLATLLKHLLSGSCISEKRFQHFSTREVIILTTAICSGWFTTKSSEGLEYSAQTLLTTLKEEFSTSPSNTLNRI
jgi:hypothetical protein